MYSDPDFEHIKKYYHSIKLDILVPKKGGGINFPVECRKLNAVTVPDQISLPHNEELLENEAEQSSSVF